MSPTLGPVVAPPPLVPSVYGPEVPRQRTTDIPGLVSLRVHDLFPDIPPAAYHGGPDTTPVRDSAERVLAGVDLDMIRPGDTVNVVCSEHGFGMLGGLAYAEMLTAVRDAVLRRTACREVRLVVVAWLGRKEPAELAEFFELDRRFDGHVRHATPLDNGIRIETALGPLFGLRKVYDADWIVHAHYDDPREVYLHRAIDRITKPFGMSYARMETRSIFHMMMGPRSGNFIGRAIADSDFVRGKLAFTVALRSSPDGILGVDADNDLDAVGDRMTANILGSYGKMLALFRSIDDVIPIIDGSKWPYYVHAGGMIFGHLYFNGRDWFDLEIPDEGGTVDRLAGSAISLGIRALVLNHTLTGLTLLGLPALYPVVVANPAMEDALRRDFANSDFMDLAESAPDLLTAVEIAKERGDSENLLCFDGSYGAINLSPSMADHLLERAPDCARVVEEELLPRWLRQRGIDPQGRRL